MLTTGDTSYPMKRTSSHGSSDSGYATRTLSVTSSAPCQNCRSQSPSFQSYPVQSYPVQSYPAQSYPAQSYPVQSYPVQSYPVQSYVQSQQLNQQSADYSHGNQISPDVGIIHAAPIVPTTHWKRRRLR